MLNFLASRKFLFRQISRRKIPARLLFFISAMSLFCGLLLLFYEAGLIYRKTENLLEKERRNQSKQAEIPFEKVFLTPHSEQNVRIFQNTQNVRSLARFQDSIFAATDGGLLQFAENGQILRHLTVLDGLPESDLTALAVFQTKLFIGTKSKGLVSFNGQNFESYRLQNHETKSITTLFSDSASLLVGTFSGGLLEFDGIKFVEIKAAGERIQHITFLQNQAPHPLLVGTFHNGLWIRQSGIWKQFTTAEGLPSNRTVGAEILRDTLQVATDFGVSEAGLRELSRDDAAQKVFRTTAVLPGLSSISSQNGRILLAKDNGELFTFPKESKSSAAAKLQKLEWKTPEKMQNSRFLKINDEIWFLSNRGIWQNPATDPDGFAPSAFGNFTNENLTENMVSSLLVDEAERLWIGTFRNGIDVFSMNGKKLKHLESEVVREINFLAEDLQTKKIVAATSGGLALFDAAFNISNPQNSLPARAVTQVSFNKNEKNDFSAIATSNGVVFKSQNSQRIFSTLNGLPSSNTFTTLFARGALFVGTLGGLVQIENGKIARLYKTSNSELKHNWITALCLSGERIFIGTYGSGIFELLPSGEIRSLAAETGKLFVNQNAIFSDRERLYAGTLEGLWCLDLTSSKWSRVMNVLPAENVLSITGNRDNIFVGTTAGIAQINKDFWSKN